MPYKDPEKRREYKHEWHLRNRDKVLARTKKWIEEHSERHKARMKKQRELYKNDEEKIEVLKTARARWKKNNKEKDRKIHENWRRRVKIETLTHYGNSNLQCVRCDEKRLACLSIDHINGNGNKHRQQIKNQGGVAFYQWLKKHNYPAGYQTLCMNCQFIKRAKEVRHEST